MDGIDGLVASNLFLIFLNYTFVNNTDLIGITICLFVFFFIIGHLQNFLWVIQVVHF